MRTRSAFVAILAACNPATTRPDFQPFPETARVVVMARRERVIPFLATLVAAESLRVRRASPVDGYLETDWYDTRLSCRPRGVRRAISAPHAPTAHWPFIRFRASTSSATANRAT